MSTSRDDWTDISTALRGVGLRRYGQTAVSVTIHFLGGDRITLPLSAPLPGEEQGRSNGGRALWASGPDPKHLSDFQRVYYPGLSPADFSFSPKQAKVVAVLWEARFELDNPDVDQAALLREADSDCGRLLDLFRRAGRTHPAWGTLIVPGARPASFRLAELPREDESGAVETDAGEP